MVITKDYSYTNYEFIKKGFARLDIHSIRLDRYFAEEQKQINIATSKKCTTEQWNERCEEIRADLANTNRKIMEELAKHFLIVNYNDMDVEYKYASDQWDLYFWCNDLYNTTGGKQSGRDMSYITLSFNEQSSIFKRFGVLSSVARILYQMDVENVQAIIQYCHTIKDDIVNKMAADIFTTHEDKFVKVEGYGEGKLKMIGNGYAFFKKRAKRTYYKLSPLAVCTMVQ